MKQFVNQVWCGHLEMVPPVHLKFLGISDANHDKPTKPGTWAPRLRLAFPPLISLSDYLQCRVKQVQRLLIDHTFVLFSYNRSILRASKHFCRAPTPVQKHRYPPCERRDVLYANCDVLGVRWPYFVFRTPGARRNQWDKQKTLESVKHFPGHVKRIVPDMLATLLDMKHMVHNQVQQLKISIAATVCLYCKDSSAKKEKSFIVYSTSFSFQTCLTYFIVL